MAREVRRANAKAWCANHRILVAGDTVAGSWHVVNVEAELVSGLDAELHLLPARPTSSTGQGSVHFRPAGVGSSVPVTAADDVSGNGSVR